MHTCDVDIHAEGLQDGCQSCERHAENPLRGLDKPMLTNLIWRTLRNRFGGTREEPGRYGERVAARSHAEARAMANVMTMLEHTGAIAQASPDLLALYLADRWKITLEGGVHA
jgi:hypothetical protein